MREPPKTIGRPLAWLGRLLPKDVRVRIFEPAYEDMLYNWLSSPSRSRRRLELDALTTWMACVPIAVPRSIVRDGRLTRAGRTLVWGGVAAVLLVLLVANLADVYASYDG